MANFNFNRVILGGRLIATPELKTTNQGTNFCGFCIAINRNKDNADFINCTAWRQSAEFIVKYFKKGDNICIEGNIQTRSYEQDGKKRTATDIIVEKAYFVSSKRKEESEPDNFVVLEEDEGLPF